MAVLLLASTALQAGFFSGFSVSWPPTPHPPAVLGRADRVIVLEDGRATRRPPGS